MAFEIVYVLTNEALHGYVKIGRTSTKLEELMDAKNALEQRILTLSRSTSIPMAFTCFYACTVKDARVVECRLHDAFDEARPNKKREFFQIAPARVVSALKLVEIEDITPNKDVVENQEDQQALIEARKIRERFNFNMAKIPVGAELVFSRNGDIKAKVIDDHSVEYDGIITSLSNSAQKLLGYNYGVAGTDYWMYEGETLDERRTRLETVGSPRDGS